MNREALSLIFAPFVGIGLGIVYFGGLWWTIQKGLLSKYASLWFLGSLLLRTGIILTGFYLITVSSHQGELKRLLLCFIGFLTARFAITRLSLLMESTHASES